MGQAYKKNFLVSVIARVDFASPLPIKESLPKEIVGEALERFPIAEPMKLQSGQVKFKKNGSVNAKKFEASTQWLYHGKEREKSTAIAPRWMWTSYTKYESFDILRADFSGILSKIFTCYEEDVVIERFGLRYINKFHFPEGDPTDWNDYLKPNLLPLPEVVTDRTKLARAFHTLEMNFDGERLKLQYGMFNADYPASIRNREFTLDLDASLQGRHREDDVQANLVPHFVSSATMPPFCS